MLIFLGLIAVLVMALIWAVVVYNSLVRNRNLVKEAWSGIDVQLKRRADLIPNLVETVKGYMGHEKDLLQKVTELRSQAGQAQTPAERGPIEGMLSQALGRLFAVAEAYPDLKANQNFLDLQSRMSTVEDEIQMSRRYYNGAARNLNIMIETFPSNIIANAFGFTQAAFFEIENAADRAVPQVKF